jgi:hypothetical protein
LTCCAGRPEPGRAPPQFGFLTFSSGMLELCSNHLEMLLINLKSRKSKNGSRKNSRQDARKQEWKQILHLFQVAYRASARSYRADHRYTSDPSSEKSMSVPTSADRRNTSGILILIFFLLLYAICIPRGIHPQTGAGG